MQMALQKWHLNNINRKRLLEKNIDELQNPFLYAIFYLFVLLLCKPYFLLIHFYVLLIKSIFSS